MIHAKSRDELAEFQTGHFMKYFNQWRDRRARYIMSNGNYSEGDTD